MTPRDKGVLTMLDHRLWHLGLEIKTIIYNETHTCTKQKSNKNYVQKSVFVISAIRVPDSKLDEWMCVCVVFDWFTLLHFCSTSKKIYEENKSTGVF